MAMDIALTAGMRNNLLSLQNTSTLQSQTQARLASGKKVNSALDNPTNFFAAQSANNRANDLTSRKDGMSEAVQMVKAADAGITGITALIESAKGVAQAALATTSTTDRATFAATFDSLMTQVTQLSSDSGYRGTNLLTNASQTVEFAPTTNAATLQIKGFDATSSGLGISGTMSATVVTATLSDSSYNMSPQTVASSSPSTVVLSGNPSNGSGYGWDTHFDSLTNHFRLINNTRPGIAFVTSHDGSAVPTGNILSGSFAIGDSVTLDHSPVGFSPTTGETLLFGTSTLTTTPGGNSWATTAGVQSSATQLEGALTTLRTQSSSLSANLAVVTTRQDFTDNMINTLQTGADNLTLADMNKEGANMLMLQTRQSLGTTSLSMASQAAQSVLKLF
jgi:flagellin